MALTTEYSAFRYLSKKELILNGDMSNLEEVMEGAKQVSESTEMSEYKLGQLNTQNTTIYEQV